MGAVGPRSMSGGPCTLFNGFYFTAITLTTIGYGGTHPLSRGGRVFTVALSYGGLLNPAYFTTDLVRVVLTRPEFLDLQNWKR